MSRPAGEGPRVVSKLFADCLVTGQMIDTGIEIDEASFALLPAFVGKIFCPHCASEHEWSKETAHVVDQNKTQSRAIREMPAPRR